LFLAPRRVFRTFLRGRSGSNPYRSNIDDALLTESMGSLRRRLNLDRRIPPATLADDLAFALWGGLSMATLVTTLLPLPPVIGLIVYLI
jgi:hypothetical protein